MMFEKAEAFAEDFALRQFRSIGVIMDSHDKRLLSIGYYEGYKHKKESV